MWEINLSPGFRADDSASPPSPRWPRRCRPRGPVVFQQMRACAAARHPVRASARSSCPTLVVHGTEDRLIWRRNGRQIAALIPGARLELLDGIGHMFWWEQPERSAELIREHALAPA